MADLPENVRLNPDGTGVIILDQTQLPARRVFLTLTTAGEMYEAIHALRVRGAPAIGVCAVKQMQNRPKRPCPCCGSFTAVSAAACR